MACCLTVARGSEAVWRLLAVTGMRRRQLQGLGTEAARHGCEPWQDSVVAASGGEDVVQVVVQVVCNVLHKVEYHLRNRDLSDLWIILASDSLSYSTNGVNK